MTNQADNGENNPSSEPASEGLTIPKHRFDEVAARLRAREEEIAIKNELLNQFRPNQTSQKEEIDFEALGLDPALGNAISRIADQLATKRVREAASGLQNQVAHIAQNAEEARFLQMHGSDKAKYLEQIKAQRVMHWQQTGTQLPIEAAYKLVMFDHMTRQTAPKAPAPAAAPAAPETPAPPAGVPDSRQTMQPGSSAAAQTPKSFNEMSVEEMETMLNQNFAQGQGI